VLISTDKESIEHAYSLTAEEYAIKFFHEFDHKPFDRMLLTRFADETKGTGVVCDMGCGPGEVAAFLHNLGSNVIGIDISEGMIRKAKELNPGIPFQRDDMSKLSLKENELAGIAAFYAIVHFTLEELGQAFKELHRVLKTGGLLLISFHIGNGIKHLDEFLGKQVSIDFTFFEPDEVLKQLQKSNFTIVDVMIRYPYENVEYPSKRCYIFATK
jgi:SAM-dependent methyltransferase